MPPSDIFPSSRQIPNRVNEPFHFAGQAATLPGSYPRCSLGRSWWLGWDEPGPHGSLFSRLPGRGICRLANGGCSVLPNVNGVKCDRFADKCKQVSFRLAGEIIPQFCNLGTIDFVDVDYSVSGFFQRDADALGCSFSVTRVRCVLISALMTDATSSASVRHHLPSAGTFVSAGAADTFTVASPLPQVTGSSEVPAATAHPHSRAALQLRAAPGGNDFRCSSWANSHSLGIFPENVTLHTSPLLQNMRNVPPPPMWLSL